MDATIPEHTAVWHLGQRTYKTPLVDIPIILSLATGPFSDERHTQAAGARSPVQGRCLSRRRSAASSLPFAGTAVQAADDGVDPDEEARCARCFFMHSSRCSDSARPMVTNAATMRKPQRLQRDSTSISAPVSMASRTNAALIARVLSLLSIIASGSVRAEGASAERKKLGKDRRQLNRPHRYR